MVDGPRSRILFSLIQRRSSPIGTWTDSGGRSGSSIIGSSEETQSFDSQAPLPQKRVSRSTGAIEKGSVEGAEEKV
ncbi:hypothetical protein IEQ34_016033 [Dendrobium chrysotoxum]|uniref:Uncharacterized protein n=1 Tax=Dendrobium chrysotoxum TaxID=161865 RepID=A0AAV7FWY1_DENCH|nr:hypothetical protein IEQ34_016033 [Dendrobium chrysotoxum]